MTAREFTREQSLHFWSDVRIQNRHEQDGYGFNHQKRPTIHSCEKCGLTLPAKSCGHALADLGDYLLDLFRLLRRRETTRGTTRDSHPLKSRYQAGMVGTIELGGSLQLTIDYLLLIIV